MAAKTKIDWCDSTLNLLVGCDGCELSNGHCYAESLVGRWAGKPGWPKAFSEPEFFLGRLEKSLKWQDMSGTKRPDKPWLDGLPRTIFVNDLSDPFTESIDLRAWGPVVEKMRWAPHIWMWLTKRPKRMAEFVDWWQRQYAEYFPANIWLGTSVTSQATMWRTDALNEIHIRGVKFISAEPLLGQLDFTVKCPPHFQPRLRQDRIELVITGGESGRDARPCNMEWIQSIVGQCRAAGVPCFVKQLGSCVFTPHPGIAWTEFDPVYDDVYETDHPKGGDPAEWPDEMRVRQFPTPRS